MAPPTSGGTVRAEASVASAVTLFGGAFALVPQSARPEGALSIAVGLDRRPFVWAEAGGEGVVVESKDVPLRIEAATVAGLPAEGLAGLVRGVLFDLGVVSGLHLVAQARVPLTAGLGTAGALAVAVAAAAARATRRTLSADALAAFALRGELLSPVLPAAGYASVWGGVAAAAVQGSAPAPTRLRVDPARIEECLLLVDSGSAAASVAREDLPQRVDPASAGGEEAVRVARQGFLALSAGRYVDLPVLLSAEQASWRRWVGPLGDPFDRLAALVAAAGGVALPTGFDPASLALVWAAPGARGPGSREQVLRALKAAAYRSFPCRVDLRGLEGDEV